MSTVSTRCSRARGPARSPSLVTWPTSTTCRPARSWPAGPAGRRTPGPGSATRAGRPLRVGHGLDRVDDDQVGAGRHGRLDAATGSAGGRAPAGGRHRPEPRRPGPGPGPPTPRPTPAGRPRPRAAARPAPGAAGWTCPPPARRRPGSPTRAPGRRPAPGRARHPGRTRRGARRVDRPRATGGVLRRRAGGGRRPVRRTSRVPLPTARTPAGPTRAVAPQWRQRCG